MDGSSSVKGFTSSSIPTNPQPNPKLGETNENDQMGYSKSHNHTKPSMKHFMSPTISAATKAAAVPVKKILADRNEAFTFTNPQFQKSPILDSKTSPINSETLPSIRSSTSSAYETDNNDEHNNSDFDSSLKKPYDPLTNYLSPRPKFLRYNPNRRQKIFLHGENETTESTNGLDGVIRSASFDSQKAPDEEKQSEEGDVKEDEKMVKNEGKHNDNDEEEEMEREDEVEEIDELEENCWSLTGLLKFLLVFGALFLSTSYICSMNSPNPSPIQEAMWTFRDEYQRVQSNMYEVIKSMKFFEGGNGLMYGRREETEMNHRDIYDGLREKEIVEDGDDRELVERTVGFDELDEVKNEQLGYASDNGLESKLEVSGPLRGSGTAEKKVEGSSNQLLEVSGPLRGSGTAEKKVEGSSNQLWGSDFTEKSESIQDDIISATPSAFNKETSVDLNSIDGKMDIEEAGKQVENGREIFEEVDDEREILEDGISNPEDDLIEAVPLAVFSIILITLGFVYCSKQRKSTIEEDSLSMETPVAESVAVAVAVDKISPAVCNVEEQKLEKTEFSCSASMGYSKKEEAYEELNSHSHAPIVQLLGELVIGESSSSPSRSFGMRKKVLDFEQTNINSFSREMMIKCGSKAPSFHSQVRTSQLELSTADSHSYKSFTAEKRKRITKKEEGKSGEVSMVEITTPVRRSSRIRNRVMSP